MKYACPMPSTSSSARPYHNGDEGREVSRLAPRRSPPRGFGGAGLEEAIATNRLRVSCAHRFLLREGQRVRTPIDHDRVALEEVALEHPERQRVEHPALDRPLQRPRAVGWIIPFAHQLFLGAFGERDMNLPLFEPFRQPGD